MKPWCGGFEEGAKVRFIGEKGFYFFDFILDKSGHCYQQPPDLGLGSRGSLF
jgi:hypothetical protein